MYVQAWHAKQSKDDMDGTREFLQTNAKHYPTSCKYCEEMRLISTIYLEIGSHNCPKVSSHVGKTAISGKPVLAMEREARLKEERDPNESQNVSCTSSGLRPRLLENSQEKSPRTKTRKHHRKNAKTLQK